jgi:hypothetical protein
MIMEKNVLNKKKLSKVLRESVTKVLNENAYNEYGVWDLVDEIQHFIGPDKLVARLISRMSALEAKKVLEEIYDTDVRPYLDEDAE